MSIEAMKQALYLIRNQGDVGVDEWIAAEAALRTAIEQAEKQKPVAWAVAGEVTDWSKDFSAYQTQTYTRPVYTTPPAAPVQGPVAFNAGVPPLYPEMKDGETISVEYTTPPAAQRQWVEVEQVKWEGDKLIAKLREKNGGQA